MPPHRLWREGADQYRSGPVKKSAYPPEAGSCTKRKQGFRPASILLRILLPGTSFRPLVENLPKLGPGRLPVRFAYGAIVRKTPQRVTRFFHACRRFFATQSERGPAGARTPFVKPAAGSAEAPKVDSRTDKSA